MRQPELEELEKENAALAASLRAAQDEVAALKVAYAQPSSQSIVRVERKLDDSICSSDSVLSKDERWQRWYEWRQP